jgi:hypothetical protein
MSLLNARYYDKKGINILNIRKKVLYLVSKLHVMKELQTTRLGCITITFHKEKAYYLQTTEKFFVIWSRSNLLESLVTLRNIGPSGCIASARACVSFFLLCLCSRKWWNWWRNADHLRNDY